LERLPVGVMTLRVALDGVNDVVEGQGLVGGQKHEEQVGQTLELVGHTLPVTASELCIGSGSVGSRSWEWGRSRARCGVGTPIPSPGLWSWLSEPRTSAGSDGPPCR